MTAAQVLAQRYGTATQMLCGPSESLLIADDSADPWRLGLDLLNEAEHGADSAATLVTDSESLAAAVEAAIAEQIRDLPELRAAAARAALSDLGGVILVDSMDAALDVANAYAAEHVQIATRDPEATLRGLRYAGEALLGQDTPIGASSYTIGIPATLPTGGYARLNGGVTARTFLTSISTARLTPEALAGLAEPTLALADHEGFPAHANAFRRRGLPGSPDASGGAGGPLGSQARDELLAEPAVAERGDRHDRVEVVEPDVVGLTPPAQRPEIGGPAADRRLGVAGHPAGLRAGALVEAVPPRPEVRVVEDAGSRTITERVGEVAARRVDDHGLDHPLDRVARGPDRRSRSGLDTSVTGSAPTVAGRTAMSAGSIGTDWSRAGRPRPAASRRRGRRRDGSAAGSRPRRVGAAVAVAGRGRRGERAS